MHRYALLAGIALFLVIFTGITYLGMAEDPDTHNVTVSLTLPGTTSTVHIPGMGPLPSYIQMDSPWPSRYISSTVNNTLHGLVFLYQSPLSVDLRSTPQNHTISLSLDAQNSRVLLVFTEGSHQNIENRVWLLESMGFLNHPSPTFGFGLGLYHDLRMLLSCQNLDIVRDFSLGTGVQSLIIEHNETTGKVNVLPQ